ncbi:MAG: hypothetical protein FRX49_00602 [Trebouxia sp. A1-2]|nr:MAG: hypothetical protein FRX49_00602 [Trebouxia sp. A1-2]
MADPVLSLAAVSAAQSASLYTAAGASSATIVYAGETSASSTPSVTPQSTITPSTSSSTATTAQENVESGGGGPDYAGAYANNFTAANVAAQPTTGSTGSPAVTVNAAGSTVIAFDTVLNPAVVYGGMASVNTASNRIIIQGSGSFAEAGLSGAIAIHAIYSTDETVLFFERPHVGAANSGVVPNPYLTHIPDCDGRSVDKGMYALQNGNGETEIGSVYDVASHTFTPFHFSTNAFCAGHSVAEDGTVIIAGEQPLVCGDNLNLVPGFLDNGLYAIRQFTFPATINTVVADMGVARWYPTTLTLQDGLIMIAGGSTAEGGGYGSDSALNEPTYQVRVCPEWRTLLLQLYNMADGVYTDPVNLPILTRTWPINLYPYMAVLPVTGSILTIAGAEIDIYNGESNPADFTGLDARYPAIPNLPVPVSYPQTATFALLSLEPANDYAAEIVVFGGTETDMATAQTPSSSSSYRINLGAATPAWETETMPYPRVMGDAVLLPDGTVFVANGGQIGIAGGVPLAAAATDGITTPVLYNPYLAAGSRYTELADSAIQRLYHSNAFLLTSGLVCDTPSFSVMQDTCMSDNSDLQVVTNVVIATLPVTWSVGGMQVLVAGSEATLDYRVQMYTPAYLQSTNPRPVMSGAPTDVVYGQAFTVNFSVTSSIDRVVMVRQSAVTHSIHMDLRMVALNITSATAGVAHLTAPPDATIAPPGYYMLFIMYLGVPAVASWVHVG